MLSFGANRLAKLDTSGNKIFTTPWCPYCTRALRLLDEKGVAYQNIDVADNRDARAQLLALTGSHTVPQIFLGGRSIGGCDDLYALDRRGALGELLAQG